MASRPDPLALRSFAAAAILAGASALGQNLPTTLPDRARPDQTRPDQTQPDHPSAEPAPPDPTARAPHPVEPAPPVAGDPEEESDPGRRVILESSRAMRKLNSLSYHSKFYGTGPIEQIAPRGDGMIRMARSERNERVWIQRASGSGMPKAGDPELSFDVAWMESGVEWIDHAQKKLMVRPLRQAKGPAYQVAGAMRLQELQDPNPLSKEVQAEAFTLESPAELDGVPCQVVLVSLAGGRTQTRWWIAETDHLPRKMSRLFTGPNGSGEIVVELTEVMPDAPFTAEDLRPQLPPGYARDESGPSLTPPTVRRGGESSPGPDAGPSPSARPSKPVAPAFELASASGGKVSLESLAGQVVVLQFWGTWHLPSRAACADLQQIARQFENQKVKVFAVPVRERDGDAAREMIRAGGYTFGLLLNGDKTAEAYHVARYPTYIVIGPGGELLDTIVGYKKDETLRKLAEAVAKALTSVSPDQATGPG